MEVQNSAPTASSFLPTTTTLYPPPIQFSFDFHGGKIDFVHLANRVIPNKQSFSIAKSYAYKLFGCATLKHGSGKAYTKNCKTGKETGYRVYKMVLLTMLIYVPNQN